MMRKLARARAGVLRYPSHPAVKIYNYTVIPPCFPHNRHLCGINRTDLTDLRVLAENHFVNNNIIYEAMRDCRRFVRSHSRLR